MTTIPAAQRAYDFVRGEILSGALRGGQLLSEVDLAGRLDVSRTPVHEAFLRLEAEDFLELLPRRGALVVPVPPAEAQDILEVRHALEVTAVRRLAAGPVSARDGFAEAVAGILAEQDTYAAARDLPGFAVADEAFHRAIVTASGNGLSARMYGTLTDRQRRMTLGAVGGRLDHLVTLVEEHCRLGELVVTGDVDAFDTALLDHLAGTHRTTFGLPAAADRR